ncbi:EAL domain-containing protein [Enterocloster hominis (ex Hitch et al. 2024)]|uniref:EAL domain-containing protein n=1 Tax=Enterocloster hominis (ex Hitch et al. 2024) TaxID=1917870 RepID=A0ABV1D4P7_9FIRM
MEHRDFTKCFVFHDMDWVQDILHMSDLGLWNMVTDRDMRNIKFYIDGTMARLLGLKEDLSPEACFEFWYKRINRGNHAYVNDVMNRIVHTGKLCEVQYTWNHPEWGDIPVRCAGRSRQLRDGRILITGYHQNMANLEQMKRWSMNVSWEEVFEYNMTSGTALIYTDRKVTYGTEKQIQGFPEVWADSDMVHPRFKETFLQAFRVLRTGGDHARCEVKLKNRNGEYSWFAMELEVLSYEEGCPEIVLGRFEDITRLKELENAYIRQARVNQLLLEDSLAHAEVDLTGDRVMRLYGTWKRYLGHLEEHSYSKLLNLLENKSVKPEDRKDFKLYFDRESLLARFEAGRHRVSMNYRRLFEGDRLRRVQLAVYMYQEPASNHIFGVFCLLDKEGRKDSDKARDREGQEPQEDEFAQLLSAVGDAACLIDPDTYELIEANQAYYRMIGRAEEDCRGHKCYELFYGNNRPCMFCNGFNWEWDRFSLWENTDARQGIKRLMKTRMVEWKGMPAVLTIGVEAAYDGGEAEPLKSGPDARAEVANKVISCIYAMIEARTLEESMRRLMDVLADHYKAGHILIYLQKENEFGYECACCRDESNCPPVSGDMESHIQAWLDQNHQGGVRDIEEPQDILPESFELYQDMEREQVSNMAVFPIVCKKGELGYIVMLERKVQDSLDLVDMLLYFIAQEISKRQDAKKLEYSIYNDSLTGLLNRSSYDRFRRSFKADNVVSIGVIIIDINDLKSVNDTRGTEAGDALIRQAAGIIEKQFGDCAVFRLNSNEFDIIMENISYSEFEHRFGALIREMNSRQNLSVSAGRVWDDRQKNLDWAMKQAGELMRIDKQRYYETKPSLTGSGRLDLIKRLLHSIESREFRVVLQPKLYLKTGTCAGAEALIRYYHPEKGIIMPSRFIGLLERENLISYVDLFVFEECCRLLEQWDQIGYREQVLSFNFSRMTLLNADIVSSVASIAKKYDVHPNKLEIEVTESIGELGRDMVYKALAEFKKLGYRISLDDFGTKYSNMDILSDVEFDVLKLDKSLVDKIDRDKVSGQIVKHIISMCHDMKIQTIAEGIEEELQEAYLKKCRCMIGQGYLYGKPMEVEEYERNFLMGKNEDSRQ